MDFKYYLAEQIKKHPSMMPQDVVKLCYQAAMGAEHLLSDISAARRYFDAEFDSVLPREGELFESLSDEICRVDLGVWKAKGLNGDVLFEAFCAAAKAKSDGRDVLVGYVLDAGAFIEEHEDSFSFSVDRWNDFLKEYLAMGMPAVHHSEIYRQAERPSYRIVKKGSLKE